MLTRKDIEVSAEELLWLEEWKVLPESEQEEYRSDIEFIQNRLEGLRKFDALTPEKQRALLVRLEERSDAGFTEVY